MPTSSALTSSELDRELDTRRRELTAYCYRMLGSGFEAEDAVQETALRAWRGIDGFAGRASPRSWLYRIATNVCLDMLRDARRRARPMDLGPAGEADAPVAAPLPEHMWVGPIADGSVLPAAGDPADVAVARESVRLAFVAALQYLPPRQRATLILRDVLRWRAAEVAELLDTTVVSVNSALQRARETLAAHDADGSGDTDIDAEQRALVDRYVAAFERYDIDALVSLLHEDATMSMPPHNLWLRGTRQISRWYVGTGAGCRDSRLVATAANGGPAFGSYRPAGDGTYLPFAIQVIEVTADRITGLHHFVGGGLFASFGLPPRLADTPAPAGPDRD